MGNIEIKTINNELLNVEVIRYFLLNGNAYLIYSQNEVDEQQYIKLYCVRVVSTSGDNVSGGSGLLTAVNVVDEAEWTAVKGAIQSIIKANNEGVSYADDLNYHLLNQITIGDSRAFKLSVALTDLLKKDKKEFPVVGNSVNVAPVQPESVEPLNAFEAQTIVPEEVKAPEPIATPNTFAFEQPVANQPVTVEPTINVEPVVNVDELKRENESLKNEIQILRNKLNQIKSLLD